VRTSRRVLARFTATTVGLGVFMLVGTGVACAHITASADHSEAGSFSVVTFSLPHGCSGSPTTQLAIQIPSSINAVTPTINPGWTIKTVMQKLGTPTTDEEGETVTKRVSEVVYTAKSALPDGYRDTFSLALVIPPDGEGTNLSFPTIQTCEKGEKAWLQVPKVGQDPEELASPAPTIVITAAADDQPTQPPVDGTSPTPEATPAPGSTDREGGTSPGWGIAGLAAGLAGLAAGSAAWVRANKLT